MRSILLVLGVSSVTAFQPADRAALKTAVDKCVSSTSTGDTCFMCDNGQHVTSAGATCNDGSSPTFISDWDTSKVTSMYELFFYKQGFDQDIGNWDTSSVTTFEWMFRGASAYSNKGEPLYWDVSSATNFQDMFRSTNLDQCLCNWELPASACVKNMLWDTPMYNNNQLGCWDLSSVSSSCLGTHGIKTDQGTCTAPRKGSCKKNEQVLNGVCAACPAGKAPAAITHPDDGDTECLTPVFKPDSAQLKTAINTCVNPKASSTGDTCYMCVNGDHVTSADATCNDGFNPTFISDWDTSLVTNMDDLFKATTAFVQDISQWDTSKVTSMQETFQQSSFNGDIGAWDTSSVTSMRQMFYENKHFDRDIGYWDTSSVTTFSEMFRDADKYNNGGKPLYWDVSNVKRFDMMFMFADAFNQCLSNWVLGDEVCLHHIVTSTLVENNNEKSVSNWDLSKNTLKFNAGNSDCNNGYLPTGGDPCVVPPDPRGSSGSSAESAKVACASHQDQSSCCAQYGCSFSNSDCIDTSALYGNTDQCTVPCAENEHVVDHVCTACPAGKSKPAGDRPGTNSDCWDAGSCGGVKCVNANTESCTDDACVCKTGFGGSACDKDITAAGLQKMLKESRKKALPSRDDLLERQKSIKDFARDTLKQKIKQGKSVKDAIKETKVSIEPSDLPQRSQMIVQLLNKAPVVAVAPANRYEEDTCAQGADTAGCSMVDLSDDADEITILSTDPEPGSWSVLSSGGAITSKQTRVSEFVYEMQCWDNGWGEKETLDVSDGAELYACNGNVIMIASQSGICTPTTCNNGNCTIDGTSYTCSCEAGWSGDHCDEVATNSQCYEFDCSNYGGHKTLEHCGGSCSASVCCNYDTKAAFNTVCDGLSSAADYVTNKCCHRDICI